MASPVSPGAAAAVSAANGGRTSSKAGGGPRGYTGPLLNSKPHGIGRQEYRDGSVYAGPFVNGVRQGPGGQFSFSNGDTYVGQFAGGDKHGRGEYRWCDGSFYNGRWERDRRSGPDEELTIASLAGAALRDHFIFSFHGRFPKISDLLETVLGAELQYRGGFKDDAVHGDGEMIFTCGANFVGKFVNGMEHGHCVLNICDGVRIEGEWFEGEVQTLVRVFADVLFPPTGKPATSLTDADVKDLATHVAGKRGLVAVGATISPQRFGDAFTRTRQLAAQAAAEGVFGRPSTNGAGHATQVAPATPSSVTRSAPMSPATAFASPIPHGAAAGGSRGPGGFAAAAAGADGFGGPPPISSAGYQQLAYGVRGMKHPTPISRAGYQQIDEGVARMHGVALQGEEAAWAVGGALTEWVEPIDMRDDGSVKPNAWWRTYSHRERRKLNRSTSNSPDRSTLVYDQTPAPRAQPSPGVVAWNTVGNAVTNPRHNEKQELRGERAKHDAEVDAVVTNPQNADEMMLLKDQPTRADVIQRIIDAATAKRKLVRCGIAVSLADCEVCSAFTNRVWWYLRTKMAAPGEPKPQEVAPESRRVVRVLDVAPGGVGELWGLTRGDAVVAYCGFPAWEHTVLRKKSARPGDEVTITVVRRTFDGDVEQAGDNHATTEPPTKMEEFASNERVIEKKATIGCNVGREEWDLLRSIPSAIKSSSSWMQDADFADLKTLLKRVRAVQVSARPEVWSNLDGSRPSPDTDDSPVREL